MPLRVLDGEEVDVGARGGEGQQDVAAPGTDLDLDGIGVAEDGGPEGDEAARRGGRIPDDPAELRVVHGYAGATAGMRSSATNSRSHRFTSTGCSCCTQWPESGM